MDVKQRFNNNKPCQQRTVHRCLCYVKPAATRAAPPCRILIADMCMKAALPAQNYNRYTMDEWRWGHSCMSLEVLAVQCRPKRCNSISVWMFCLDVHALTTRINGLHSLTGLHFRKRRKKKKWTPSFDWPAVFRELSML